MRLPICGMIAGALLLLAAPACQKNDCDQDRDLDRKIAGCTGVVDDRKESARIGGFAYNSRGNAWSAKGDHDHAIADYTEAIRLDPKSFNAYKNRGQEYFYKGEFPAAAADMLRATDLAHEAYPMLWQFLARGRMGQDGAAELSANAARLKTKDWPYQVIDFYLGRRSLDEMRTAASKPEEKCEAVFYAGQWHLLRVNKADAKVALQNAADTCPKNFSEYAGAVAELKRLNP